MIFSLFACTNTKSVPNHPLLQMASYANLTLPEALKAWNKALDTVADEDKVRAGQLYKGVGWQVVTTARTESHIPMRALVVSAGLGLIETTEWVPSYASTFTANTIDSIPGAGPIDVSKSWWEGLGGLERLKQLLDLHEEAKLICVLPYNYLHAVSNGLVWFVEKYGAESLFILGSDKFKNQFPSLQDSWVPLDARMTKVIGGKVGDLNAYAYLWLMRHLKSSSDLNLHNVRKIFNDISFDQNKSFYPKRKKCTPEEVREWLVSALESDEPPKSKTGALRLFRENGFAFESKRFSLIYNDILKK